jgi:phosphoglycolate phosphatase
MKNHNYAIVFDLDGVLLDSESDMTWMKNALIDTLIYFNIPPNDENITFLDTKNLSKFPEVANNFNIEVKDLWKIRNKFYTSRKVAAITNEEILPFPDITALDQLHPQTELAIISNSPQEVVEAFLKQFKLQYLFSTCIGRSKDYEDIFRLKPHPLLWQKLKPFLHASSVIYVGDRASDQEFAQITGMTFLGLNRYDHVFTTGYASLHEIVNEIQKIIKN